MFSKSVLIAVVTAVCLLSAPQARAQELYCNLVSGFLGAAAGAGFGASAGTAIQAGLAYVGMEIGHAALSGQCQKGIQDFIDNYTQNPIDYDDFVSNHCGGNPLTCPGNLNVHKPWESYPWECEVIAACGMPWIRGPYNQTFTSVSVNDVINAMTFVDISKNHGHWTVDYYGYLIGYDPSIGTLVP